MDQKVVKGFLPPSARRVIGPLVVVLGTSIAASEAGEPAAEDRASLVDSLLESRPQSDASPLVRVDLESGVAVAYLAGHVTWEYSYEGESIALFADRLRIEVRLPERPGAGPPDRVGAVPPDRVGAAASPPPAADGPRDGRTAAATASRGDSLDLSRVRDFKFLAEGNVRVEVPARSTFFEADSFYYENATGRGVAKGVRLRTTYRAARGVLTMFDAERAAPPRLDLYGEERSYKSAPLTVRADLLRLRGFEWFGGDGVEVTTCDFGVPHWAVRAERVQVRPVQEGSGRDEAAPPAGSSPPTGAPGDRGPDRGGPLAPAFSGGEDLLDRDWTIDPESAWVAVHDVPIVPLPVTRWDTRWQTHLPMRSIDVGHSSQFGFFGGADWNLNYFLESLPTEKIVPISVAGEETRLGFETDYMQERGFGWGPNALYGTRPSAWEPWQLQLDAWTSYGEAQYWAIQDQGDQDRSTGLPIPDDDRYWGHAWHRQSIPYLGLLELEYSKISDRAFLEEYFESVSKNEKEQETLAYLQRNFLDNAAATALYQVRVNDFQTQTERIPEGRLRLIQQPIWSTGLYTDLDLQAAYLRPLSDDALGIAPRDYGRFDVLNEWSYPLGLPPYFQLRPFGLARYTSYGEVLDANDGAEDRASFGAGITASQEWSRTYRYARGSLARDWLGLSVLRHSFVPEVTYLNVFANDLASSEVIQVDDVDGVDLQESISFSLRNEFLTRDPVPGRTRKLGATLRNRDDLLETSAFRTRSILQSGVSFVVYPRADRDNDGEATSMVILDNTAWLTRAMYLRGWIELDPARDFGPRRIDTSIGYDIVPGRLWASVGNRLTDDLTNYLFGAVSFNVTDRWNVDAYYAHDFETGEDVEYRLGVSRIFHRFVLSFDVSMDVGEDRNLSVYLSVSPIELWQPARDRAVRSQ